MVLFFSPSVSSGKDVNVLAPGLGKASHLKTIYVMSTFVSSRYTYTVKTVVLWEGLYNPGVQDIYIGRGNSSRSGSVKEGLKL